MRSRIHRPTGTLGAFLVSAFVAVATLVIVVSGISHAEVQPGTHKGRLITIHDRGVEKVILSSAETVGDAIREAGISIDNHDAVEPVASKKLVASEYQVNIYRARSVMVVDGNVRQKTITAYQTAEQIVQSVGITLYPEDQTNFTQTENISDGAIMQLNIKRATPFEFTLYGRTNTARSQELTVGDMLNEKGVKLTRDDRVVPGKDTKLTAGINVKVWREGKQTVTVDEPVNFDIQQIKDTDRAVGYKDIQVPGVVGSRNVTYEIMIKDGQEVGRREIASLVTKQPKKQVEVVGAKGQYTTPSENENITWDFLISNGFTRNQTAGIMGNLKQEHGFNTSPASGGYGIAQWTGSRAAALQAMPYPENIYTQLNFLMRELNGSYSGVRDAIRASTTVDNAVIIFQNRFERCGICRQDSRIQFAYNILASH